MMRYRASLFTYLHHLFLCKNTEYVKLIKIVIPLLKEEQRCFAQGVGRRSLTD